MRFIHTADWQLGKPFANVSDQDKRALVKDVRFETVKSLTSVVERHGISLVVVAGDLFDSPSASRTTVSKACEAIGSLKVPVLVIPGNHDHGGPGSIWEQEFFKAEQSSLAPNLRVLLEPEPVELEEAVILPCPLLHRRVVEDPTQWLRSFDFSSLPADKPRIVVAHGSVSGFGGEWETEEAGYTNTIDLDALPMEEIDYLALGDWHGTKQVNPKAWYSGTPEPDRFPKGDGYDPGNVLVVEARRGEPPAVVKERTARLRWNRLHFSFAGPQDLERLEMTLSGLLEQRVEQDLLHVVLEGPLGIEDAHKLQKVEEKLRARLLHLQWENNTTTLPTEEEVELLTERKESPLISSVASSLIQMAEEGGEEAEVARWALKELYTACKEG